MSAVLLFSSFHSYLKLSQAVKHLSICARAHDIVPIGFHTTSLGKAKKIVGLKGSTVAVFEHIDVFVARCYKVCVSLLILPLAVFLFISIIQSQHSHATK